MKFAHVINPVKISESSDFLAAQPVTFEIIRRAKEFAIDIVNFIIKLDLKQNSN